MDIEKLVCKSPLHRSIVRFFHENQSSLDTPRGIATWVRGDYTHVKHALTELAKAGVLEAHEASSTIGYSYTRDPKIIKRVETLLNK